MGLVWLGLLVIVANSQFTEENHVVVLNDKNFNLALKTYDYMLVDFYAPWCAHCKTLEPELAKAAEQLKREYITVAKIDCTENKNLAVQFQIRGYPTLKFIRNGKAYDYKGKRDVEGIVEWMKVHSVPRITYIANQLELQQFIDTQKLVLMYFSANNQKSIELNIFEQMADKFEGVYFGVGQSQELRQWQNLAVDERVVLYTPYETKEKKFKEDINEDTLKSFLANYSFPVIFSYNDREQEYIQQSKQAVMYLFQDSDKKEYDEVYYLIASEYKSQLVFVSLNRKNVLEKSRIIRGQLDSIFGLKKYPSLFIYETKNSEKLKYKLEKEITQENVKEFIQQWQQNKLEPWYKSEKMPITNMKPVKVVVGINYPWEVIEHEKDVLLFFYTPWCTQTKKFLPTYEKVAEKLQKINPNIVLAKIDYTENEIPGIFIADSPTIKLFRKGDKLKLFDFRGEKTEEALLKFLKENTSHPWVEIQNRRDDL